MNSLDGEDKKLVKTLGTSSYFYAMASKVKIKDFGNPFVVPHLKFKTIWSKEINIKNKLGFCSFHQQLCICVSWISLLGYKKPLPLCENLVKALSVFPKNHQIEFFKHTKDFNMFDETINLTTLQKCLEKQLQTIFNHLVNISAAEIKNKHNKKQIKNQKLHDGLSK